MAAKKMQDENAGFKGAYDAAFSRLQQACDGKLEYGQIIATNLKEEEFVAVIRHGQNGQVVPIIGWPQALFLLVPKWWLPE